MMEENSNIPLNSKEDVRISDVMDDKKEKDSIFNKIPWFYVAVALMIISAILFIVVIILGSLCKVKETEEIEWEPTGDKITTDWAFNLDVNKIWDEYPRPQMVREKWMNLNGIWKYSIVKKGSIKPLEHDGDILVPFPVESALSGVQKKVTENDEIWYQREFEIPEDWQDKDILLHFGAVDWQCTVYVNYKKVGFHSGGYTPFYFEITQYLKPHKKNILIVKVYDPTDKGFQAVGKQMLNHTGSHIWYTPSSGIWQTVWLEPVNSLFIKNIQFNHDYDSKQITLKAEVTTEITIRISAFISYQGTTIGQIDGNANQDLSFQFNESDFHPWSPEEPNLYDIKILLYSLRNETYDEIQSYTAMRKIQKWEDENKKYRIKLNDKKYFAMGILDQGFFPDGLYTAPSEDAMLYDIQKAKDMGFNTIRKHLKVESARFYYNCDKIGMLVWQDMPAGNMGGNVYDPHTFNGGTDVNRTEESKTYFKTEWAEIMLFCKFFQSIIAWVPFNEAMGQFDTIEISNLTKQIDPTRLIDPASGGNFRATGDILDMHHYPWPYYEIKEPGYIDAIGEYGGVGLYINEHSWSDADQSWSNIIVNSSQELENKYQNYTQKLIEQGKEGIASAIFTQIVDVEQEINGLISYDRKYVKVNETFIQECNQELITALTEEENTTYSDL